MRADGGVLCIPMDPALSVWKFTVLIDQRSIGSRSTIWSDGKARGQRSLCAGAPDADENGLTFRPICGSTRTRLYRTDVADPEYVLGPPRADDGDSARRGLLFDVGIIPLDRDSDPDVT